MCKMGVCPEAVCEIKCKLVEMLAASTGLLAVSGREGRSGVCGRH